MLSDHFGYLRCFDGNEQNDQDIYVYVREFISVKLL